MTKARKNDRLVIFGYGNPSRGDDALGPELLHLLAEAKERHPEWGKITFIDDLQLQLEHALDLVDQDLALFIDASLSCPAPYRLSELRAARDISYASHAMSPVAVLHVYEQITNRPAPPSYLLELRGQGYELGESLTTEAQHNLQAAFEFCKTLCRHQNPRAWHRQSESATMKHLTLDSAREMQE